MEDVFVISDNIISPVGSTTTENFSNIKRNISGIREHAKVDLSADPFYASIFDNNNAFGIEGNDHIYTKFEQLLISSIFRAFQNAGIDPADKKSILIISTTKGNISLIETERDGSPLNKRIALHTSAGLVGDYFHLANKPLVVSNACISGLLGIITGMRLIQSGLYQNAIISGADVVSRFVLSGFQSLQAISKTPCKPFDRERDGINLGEGAGTIILSSGKRFSGQIRITGGSISNDANHISGSSRTGEELNNVIRRSLQDSALKANGIDFISAHGTATIYNDEMEAKAFSLAGMQSVSVNSLKGYFGHTLGAAGIIESIITIQSMKENIKIPTKGFEHLGVSSQINVCHSLRHASLNNCIKTASGFGGCNAAVVFSN
jgi:3-oxoacyl-[acyl-carrier-protein] synthase-1